VYSRAAFNDKRKRGAEESGPRVFANDMHPGALSLAMRAAEAAGVRDLIQFSCKNIDAMKLTHTERPGTVCTNPPWDKRLQGAVNSWIALGEFAEKNMSPGAHLWTLSGTPGLSREIPYTPKSRFGIRAAGTDMEFCRFVI
jgi:23S rRNA G2445 N2-methylase RlmL